MTLLKPSTPHAARTTWPSLSATKSTLFVPNGSSAGSLISQAPTEAEAHLTEALTRCRRINNVENEPDILVAFGRLCRARQDFDIALAHAREALAIADRCEYRLVQADCHNLLAHLALDVGDRATALRHAEIARERALCDDPEYCYKPALDEADALLAELRT